MGSGRVALGREAHEERPRVLQRTGSRAVRSGRSGGAEEGAIRAASFHAGERSKRITVRGGGAGSRCVGAAASGVAATRRTRRRALRAGEL